MKKLLVTCLVAAVLLWGWALFWPKQAAPLEGRFAGDYVVYRFEPPAGVTMPSPKPRGQVWRYTFRPDGSYLFYVELPGGLEMSRREGMVEVDERGMLTVRPVSENRVAIDLPPERYSARWETDTHAPDPTRKSLVLRHADEGFEYYLAPNSIR